jgi:hypothetical protein
MFITVEEKRIGAFWQSVMRWKTYWTEVQFVKREPS